ncbi:hypothetical protein OAX32_01975 [Flavobacteriales bacterium]|nr:hypothetical protein [Flavobacteriales bacterium]
MKQLLLILLCLPLAFSSCGKKNKYNEAVELYNQGVKEKSNRILEQATIHSLQIEQKDIYFNKAQTLIQKIDSTKLSWYSLEVKNSNKQKEEEQTKIEAEQNKLKLEKEKNKPLKKLAIGKNIFDYTQNNNYGLPETIVGLTDNKYWVVYYRDVDVTLVSLKSNDVIKDACFGYKPGLRKGWH